MNLDEIMATYAGLVYTIVYNKLSGLGTREDIEECVSDVFFELYKNRNSIDLCIGSFKSYLSVISKRKAIDAYRRKLKEINKTVSLDELSDDILQTDDELIEASVINKETKEALVKGIKALGEPDSEIFILKYFFGLSTKSIAQKLDLKENTVDKKVSRGLDKLKTLMGGVL